MFGQTLKCLYCTFLRPYSTHAMSPSQDWMSPIHLKDPKSTCMWLPQRPSSASTPLSSGFTVISDLLWVLGLLYNAHFSVLLVEFHSIVQYSTWGNPSCIIPVFCIYLVLKYWYLISGTVWALLWKMLTIHIPVCLSKPLPLFGIHFCPKLFLLWHRIG